METEVGTVVGTVVLIGAVAAAVELEGNAVDSVASTIWSIDVSSIFGLLTGVLLGSIGIEYILRLAERI